MLDNTTMPIVGDPLTVNDTYVEQIVRFGEGRDRQGRRDGRRRSRPRRRRRAQLRRVHDREPAGALGPFPCRNRPQRRVQPHADAVRVPIRTTNVLGGAGAYTKRCRRSLYADKINEPILLIHGEADNNQGTFPIQSERLFAAISGLGGTARLVMLPLEAHGYAAKESTEHVLYEMINWFDKYVKNAKPRTQQAAK